MLRRTMGLSRRGKINRNSVDQNYHMFIMGLARIMAHVFIPATRAYGQDSCVVPLAIGRMIG
jgi:hypothetical protein